MAPPDEFERPIRLPLAASILGKVLERKGMREGNLLLVRMGRQRQAEANALLDDPSSRPTSTKLPQDN